MFESTEQRRLDHMSLMVRDIETVAGLAGRLGFTVSPYLDAEEPIIQNRIAAVGDDGLDFMTIVKPGVLPGDFDGILKAREGLFCLVFRVDTKEQVIAAEADLKALGCQTLCGESGRSETQEDGSVKRAHWMMSGGWHPDMFFLRICICCHYDLDAFLQPARKHHANGALATKGIVTVAQDMATARPIMDFLFHRDNVTHTATSLHAQMAGGVCFEVYDPAALAALYDGHIADEGHDLYVVGQEFQVESLPKLHAQLEKSAVPFHILKNGKTLIPPHYFGNVTWTFSGEQQ
ncbi:MAG: VOC family protein [Pseudomonadota bacterium]